MNTGSLYTQILQKALITFCFNRSLHFYVGLWDNAHPLRPIPYASEADTVVASSWLSIVTSTPLLVRFVSFLEPHAKQHLSFPTLETVHCLLTESFVA